MHSSTITCETFDSDATEVLRLNSAPARIQAGGNDLHRVEILKPDGYTVRKLPAGGVAVQVQHKTAGEVKVSLVID